MARNLSEVLGRPPEEHYAVQFIEQFPSGAGTPPEYIAIAANAYGAAKAEKVGDLRVSTKVVHVAEKARATGIDPDPLLINAAEKAQAGRKKIIAKEHVVVTLDQLVQQKQLQDYRTQEMAKPLGKRRA
jgi:hypothetical protein